MLQVEFEAAAENAEIAATIAEIDASPFFDDAFYRQQSGLERGRRELVQDYVLRGERAGLQPSASFDPRFYASIYADVASWGGNLLWHYLRYGRQEARYPDRDRLRRDAAAVRSSRVISAKDRAFVLLPSAIEDLSSLEAHIAVQWRGGDRLIDEFDDQTYIRLYPDVAASQLPPLVHFARFGLAQGRIVPGFSKEDVEALRGSFDVDYYRRQRPELPLESDALLDYLTSGRWDGYAASPLFQQEYYLRRYPDIDSGAIEPYLHFLQYGKGENRVGRASFADRIEEGEQLLDPDRETILVASHEASRTGAPLVALAVGEYLSRSFNVIYAIGRTGPIAADFKRSAVAIVTGTVTGFDAPDLLRELRRDYGLSAAVLNSVETYELAEGALEADIPSIGLIHEFAEYSAGRIGRMTAAVDRGILPARLLLDSAQSEMTRDYAAPANNLIVHPQGFLPSLPDTETDDDLTVEEILAMVGAEAGQRPKIVLGAGFVHIRKGIDLFIQAAAAVRALSAEPVRFVWVGHGFDPRRDHHYSLWIDDMIKRLDLEDTMFFFDPQGSLDAFFELADVFFLSSRLDPFPNVVLDAFEAGRPVVCFDRATGVADWLKDGRAVGAAVGFCDASAAAAAIVDLFRAGREVGVPNALLAETQFSFDAYGELIVASLRQAKALRAEQLAVVDRLIVTDAFDAAFHEGRFVWGQERLRALKRYVARGVKGLSRINPRPGFSDNLYKSRAGLDPAGRDVALDHAVRHSGSQHPRTHRCLILEQNAAPVLPFTGRIAVHLHLHYSELAAEFARRLASFDREMDVFVTAGGGRRMAEVNFAFSGYKRGEVHLLEAPNRGRDIGPFITAVGEHVLARNYDLIGHFHGKKSMAVENVVPGLGDRWRQFLTDTLLGTRADLVQILGQFAVDPELGLLFAEDRNAVGWATNLAIADDLAARMTPRPTLPAAPFYPLGNMFWARPAAVRPLWDLGLTWSDYPAEPVAYDGTILHAVERMLPSICESTGHGWMTVLKPGTYW